MREGRDCVLALQVSEQVKNRKFCRSDELKKRELREVDIEVVSPTKKHARKDSNHLHTDEICSGNSDPIVIQNSDINAFGLETSNSNSPNKLCVSGNGQVDSGDITSESSSQSCTESGFCTSYATQDSSKYGNTTGVPKIRLKVPKQSEECSSNLSNSSARIFSNELNDATCTDDAREAVKRRALPSKSVGKSLNQQSRMEKKRDEGDGKKRNDDLHKLLFLPSGLPDGTPLAYHVKGQKILEGYKKENGIFCNHCSNVISPSQFEAHAGMATRKKPYQHIYDANGFTLHDIAISLAKGQKNQTADPMSNDDTRLLSSDCVDSLSRPRSMIIRLGRPAVKKSKNDYGGNCVLCLAHDFSVNRFDDRTIILCDQCEKEYHVGCLREAGCCDLKELPKNKWFCCYDCERIFSSLRDLVARGSEVIPFSETSKINKKLVEKGLCEVAGCDVQLRLLNGKCCLPKHQPLLAKVIYLFRKGFNPITTATGRDLIPSMVHGKNVYGQEFGGMYCLVLTVKSVVVSAGLLRVCGRELAELPLVATRKKHQGKGYFLALFTCIEKLLGSLKVEKLVLPAAEYAKSMWLNRFGFKEMSQDKLCMYTRMFQLTQFSETVMLVKQVEQQNS